MSGKDATLKKRQFKAKSMPMADSKPSCQQGPNRMALLIEWNQRGMHIRTLLIMAIIFTALMLLAAALYFAFPILGISVGVVAISVFGFTLGLVQAILLASTCVTALIVAISTVAAAALQHRNAILKLLLNENSRKSPLNDYPINISRPLRIKPPIATEASAAPESSAALEPLAVPKFSAAPEPELTRKPVARKVVVVEIAHHDRLHFTGMTLFRPSAGAFRPRAQNLTSSSMGDADASRSLSTACT